MFLFGYGEGGVASYGADLGFGIVFSFLVLIFDIGLIRFLFISSAFSEFLFNRFLGLYVGSTMRSFWTWVFWTVEVFRRRR